MCVIRAERPSRGFHPQDQDQALQGRVAIGATAKSHVLHSAQRLRCSRMQSGRRPLDEPG